MAVTAFCLKAEVVGSTTLETKAMTIKGQKTFDPIAEGTGFSRKLLIESPGPETPVGGPETPELIESPGPETPETPRPETPHVVSLADQPFR